MRPVSSDEAANEDRTSQDAGAGVAVVSTIGTAIGGTAVGAAAREAGSDSKTSVPMAAAITSIVAQSLAWFLINAVMRAPCRLCPLEEYGAGSSFDTAFRTKGRAIRRLFSRLQEPHSAVIETASLGASLAGSDSAYDGAELVVGPTPFDG